MTDTVNYDAPPRILAEIGNPLPFLAVAVVALIVGYWWFPAWFLAAQIIRVWSSRGGVRWLHKRGVPEYDDDRYAAIFGNALIVLIALRLLLAINWLESFEILGNQGWAMHADPQQATYLAVILGISIALALTGALRTKRLPWIFATAGFVLVFGLAATADGRIWSPNTIEAAPLVLLAYLVSRIPMFFDRRLDKREAKREEEALEANRARA
jgi:signal transduction histidine kinase